MEYKAIVRRASSDELEHKRFKYIKKVKGKNGKYRYIYDIKDALGYDERESYRKAESDHERATAETDHALNTWWKVTEENYRTANNNEYLEGKHANVIPSSMQKHREQQQDLALRNLLKKRSADSKAFDKYLDAQIKYGKTPLYKLEKLTQKGKNFLSYYL